MKKCILTLLLLALTLFLCACAEHPTETVPQTQETTGSMQTTVPDDTTGSTATTAADLKALAMSCIDQSVDTLYDLIGEPQSADYAPSCLGDGEDGNLYYDGFTVYTYREGESETVSFVE